MTNLEKWYKEVLELKLDMAVVDGIPASCNEVPCEKCKFYFYSCTCMESSYRWLWHEYQEPDV